MSMAYERAFNIENVSERAHGYNIPGITVDGNDILEVYTTVREAAEHARKGNGPTLIESKTYRYKGHSKSDRQAYRTRDEVNDWKDNRDPITRLGNLLAETGVIAKEEVKTFRADAVKIIDDSVEFSEESPEPDIDTLMEGVYA